MQRLLGILFTICAVLFVNAAFFFLCTAFIARIRPDLLPFSISGYALVFLMSAMCAALAWMLFMIGKKLRSRD